MSRKGENIYKRKDGRWEGRYKCGFDTNGKTKYRSIYSKTYTDCKKKLSSVKTAFEQNRNYVKVEMTVKDISCAWLANISINVKKSTYDTYCLIINNHIVTYMGGIRVDAITPEYLNSFVGDKVKNGRKDGKGGLSCKTVQNIVGVLKSVFKYAEKIYGIKNPTNFITVPKSEKKEPEVLTQNEINKIRKYCNEHSDYFKYVFELCLSTGIRIGELCALQ
ncbi:MAG: tyrosine-type recombinase/integrase family protein, partial [Firmicutes bacterium]|nr:tyrosine-type recombinase/integrase family protein [Bacillota bacterium]